MLLNHLISNLSRLPLVLTMEETSNLSVFLCLLSSIYKQRSCDCYMLLLLKDTICLTSAEMIKSIIVTSSDWQESDVTLKCRVV